MADIKKLHSPIVEEPPLTEFDRIVIGKAAVRFHIPVSNPNDLRKYLDLMAGWIEDARFQLNRPDAPTYDNPQFPAFRRSQYAHIRREAHMVSREIARIAKRLKDDEL